MCFYLRSNKYRDYAHCYSVILLYPFIPTLGLFWNKKKKIIVFMLEFGRVTRICKYWTIRCRSWKRNNSSDFGWRTIESKNKRKSLTAFLIHNINITDVRRNGFCRTMLFYIIVHVGYPIWPKKLHSTIGKIVNYYYAVYLRTYVWNDNWE